MSKINVPITDLSFCPSFLPLLVTAGHCLAHFLRLLRNSEDIFYLTFFLHTVDPFLLPGLRFSREQYVFLIIFKKATVGWHSMNVH